ncbi:MAG: hypothetical protein C0505_00420 [Leptothrix sp. (in: Bacteria)]|nr:hypothetical protein [Leptothrix sp. (in: b-proteobacteria)]
MTAQKTAETRLALPEGRGLAAPPPDVQGLLRCCGAALPTYFDAHSAEAERRSRQDWPCLWQLAPDRR